MTPITSPSTGTPNGIHGSMMGVQSRTVTMATVASTPIADPTTPPTALETAFFGQELEGDLPAPPAASEAGWSP